MNDAAPVVYLLHGDDSFAQRQSVETLVEKMGDPSTGEMNTTRLEGGDLTLDALRTAASAVPFLAERRLVVAENASRRFNSQELQEKFVSLLDQLPQSTALVLLEDKALPESHWLMKWAAQAGGRAYVRLTEVPKGAELVKWVQDYAKKQGGEVVTQAALLLAEMAGEEPRLAATEVDKLLAYVNYARPVELDDVESLSAFYSGRGDYYKFIDALLAGNGRLSMDMLQRLLDEEDPLRLFFRLVDDCRLLVQVREIYESGGLEGTVASQFNLHPYRAKKLYAQAKTLPMGSLENIYRKLADYDLQIKTGQVDAGLALETLVAVLAAV
jgi:DNA polymerase-3 subunit delta